MATHDPIVRKFAPDPTLVHRAHNMLLDEEREDPARAFVRQQWDAAFGATRVAMDALREIWPSEAAQITDGTGRFLVDALNGLEEAYHALDSVAEEMVGDLMVAVQRGRVRTEEEFLDYVGDDSAGSPSPAGELPDAHDEA